MADTAENVKVLSDIHDAFGRVIVLPHFKDTARVIAAWRDGAA